MKPTKSQIELRQLGIRIQIETDEWVVPKHIWEDIDARRYAVAKRKLTKQSKIWPNDPHITYATSLVKMLSMK